MEGNLETCICGSNKERTEHVMSCKAVQERIKTKVELKWLKSEKTEDLCKVTEYIKLYIKVREEERSTNAELVCPKQT